jgi:hypothetical protein
MKKIGFTTDQVQQIISTIAEMPAKACFDTLVMITKEVEEQTKPIPLHSEDGI